MRQEALDWFRQAQRDLKIGKILMENDCYDGAVFHFHQSVEKGLKALGMVKLKDALRGHSLVFLAKQIKLPQKYFTGVMDLNPAYSTTRYPDVAQGLPAELYNEEIATRHEKTAVEVLEWIKRVLK